MDEQQFELLLTMAMVLRASSHRFIGRLAWDPELKAFDSGKCVAKSRLLVNLPGAKRDDGSKPDGFTLELWNEDAQRFVDGAHKGDLVEVVGRARTNRWTDRNTGEVKKEVLIEVERWDLVRPAGQQAAPAAPASAPAQHPAYAAAGYQPQAQAVAPAPAAPAAPGWSAGEIPF